MTSRLDMLPLSPEICSKITGFLSTNPRDLHSLCLTCKAFQREAEAKIYSQIMLEHPSKALRACTTLINNERLALLVRTFWFNLDDRYTTVNLGREFWTLIQNALIAVKNLEILLICDHAFTNSWIFDTPQISFRVQEARLKFMWDPYIVKFLQSQRSLRLLHFYDAVEEVVEPLPADSLPQLRSLDTTLAIGLQFLGTRIAHLQLMVDSDPPQWIDSLYRFKALRATLRSFSLLELPDDISGTAAAIIAQVLPDLRHIGLFPYPMTNRHEFYKHLMRMHSLQSIELELSRWNPAPTAQASQRSIAAELRTFCPSLKIVVFWMNTVRIQWQYANERWQSTMQSQQCPQLCDTWRLVE